MSPAALKSHIVIKSLKNAGFDDQQAETIVEAISDMQDSQLATKNDITQLETKIAGELKTINQSISRLETNMDQSIGRVNQSIGRLETNMEWIKKLLITIGVAVVIAAVKYVFNF